METLWIQEKPRQCPCLPSIPPIPQPIHCCQLNIRIPLPKDHILHPSQGATAQTGKFITWDPCFPSLSPSPQSIFDPDCYPFNTELGPPPILKPLQGLPITPRNSSKASPGPLGFPLLLSQEVGNCSRPFTCYILSLNPSSQHFVRLRSHYFKDTQCILWPPSLPNPLSLVPGLLYILPPLITVNLSSVTRTKR